MTTRWEKGDSHIKLIVEGESTNAKEFKSALDINLEGNILIDLSVMEVLDSDSKQYLDEFAKLHKAKMHSIIIASHSKIKGLKNLEVVPTVSEARELIFMEITERELGFWGEDLKE